MIDDPKGWNDAQAALASRAAARGDYSAIEARARAGADLSKDELAALDRRDRGEKIKTGRKDPATDFEAWANFVWLAKNHRVSKSTAYSLLAEMTGQQESAIKSKIERIARQDGTGKSIADQVAKETIKRKATPPLLMNRSENWKCVACKMIACSCDRPQWGDTDAGAVARALVGFLDPI
ncbi:hypothetical protein [Primorskyibacter sp. 2E233]|uniref:hypothetical protein n=1 Tax=Primorskyibacter sp. 2E233 TaxID=3413431 RepID=UPI003BF43EB4